MRERNIERVQVGYVVGYPDGDPGGHLSEQAVRVDVKSKLVNRLRELRLQHGLTQEQLASDLDVTRHTILALEVGRYVPSIELALRLAAYFDRPLETIFGLDPQEDRRLRGQAPTPAAPTTGNEAHHDG